MGQETIRMLNFHPITAFMKTLQTSKNILIRVFVFVHIFLIEFQISIFDKVLLPKTVSHSKGNTTLGDVFSGLRADMLKMKYYV